MKPAWGSGGAGSGLPEGQWSLFVKHARVGERDWEAVSSKIWTTCESKGSPGGSEVREVMGGLVGRGWEGLQGLRSAGQRLFVN